MDNSKVLVLDTKNLKGYWDDHGSDYSVTLAKEDSRPPLPRKYTICNSGFFGGLLTQGINSQMWWFKIRTEDKTGDWMKLFSYKPFKQVATEDIKQALGFVINGAWLNPGPDYGPLLFNRWHHICMCIDLDREVFSFVLNGVKLDDLKVRLEICQKIYTTRFSGQKFYTLKVRKLRLFLLKINSVNSLISLILVASLLEFN